LWGREKFAAEKRYGGSGVARTDLRWGRIVETWARVEKQYEGEENAGVRGAERKAN